MVDFDTSQYVIEGKPRWRDRPGNTGNAALDHAAQLSVDVWQSFEHSVKQPVLAVAEISDNITGSRLTGNKWLSAPAPTEAAFNTSRYWAQQTGATLGSLPWFSLLHKVVGAGMHKAVGPGVFESMTTRQLHQFAIAESMVTGFTYGALLKPSRCDERRCLPNFTQERLLTGATTAATFGVSSLASAKIHDYFGVHPSPAQKIATSFASSALAGGFDSEIQAIRKHGRLATEQEFAKGVFTYAVIGAGMSTIHELLPSSKAESLKQRDSSYHPEERAARLALLGLPQNVRQAAFRGDTEAVIFSMSNTTNKPAGTLPAIEAVAATPKQGSAPAPIEPLFGAPRIVYDRLAQAGLRPRIEEVAGGREIRVPLSGLQPGANALLRRAIQAVDKGIEDRTRGIETSPNPLQASEKPQK